MNRYGKTIAGLAAAVFSVTAAADDIDCNAARTQPAFNATLDSAMRLRSSGRVDAAEQQVQRVLAVAPANPRALYSLGMVQLDRQHLAEAAATMERAVAVRKKCGEAAGALNSNIYNNIGYAYVLLGNYGAAVSSLKAALASPTLPRASRTRALSNLGYAYFITGNFDLAKPALSEAVAANSTSAAYTLDVIKRAEKTQRTQQVAQ